MATATLAAPAGFGLDLSPARPLWIARLSGEQVAMGRQHAALVKGTPGWSELIDYYARMPEMILGGARDGEGPTRIARAVRPLVAMSLRALEGRRPRLLRARSRAFFAGLGLPEETSRHVLAMDVLQNVINLAGRFGHGPSRRIASRAVPACTTLAVWGRASATGEVLHARNFDFPGSGVWERHPAVVFCAPREGLRYGFVTTRGADVPGVSAFNEAGLCLTSHTRFHKDASLIQGRGIVDLCHEIVRRARTLDEALRIARARPAASTWGLVISSAAERRAFLLEITSRAVEVVEPRPGEDFLANTNRYVSPSLQSGQVAPAAGFVKNSDGRLCVARAWGQRGGLSVEDLGNFLASDEDPDVSGATRTAGGTVAQAITVHSVVIQPEAQAVHVSVGPVPTGQGPYVTVPWSWTGEPEAELIEPPEVFRPEPSDRELARAAYLEGARLQGAGGRHLEVEDALLRAVEHDPEDPSYRLLAGAYALRRHDLQNARAHFEAGLERERSPFHRAQLLLWASRAAAIEGDREQAERLRGELLGSREPLAADYQAAARREASRPFRRRALRRVEVHLGFPDVFLG
ncbi:MAG: C45 family autoproteolytic acyltransferase/hydrolase [Planctomycetota bacterium]